MQKFLPIFPLNLILFPKEKLNLHIFEPRYKQLINECIEQETTFGILPFLDNKLQNFGTEVKVTKLKELYEDGRMDIETLGIQVFFLNKFLNPAPGKLYSGGDVSVIPFDNDKVSPIKKELIDHIQILYDLLEVKPELDYEKEYLTYEVAHKIGLSVDQEYELLKIESEYERQRYLLGHLKKAIPIITEMEKTKERIKLNGHFKHFDPLKF